MRRRRREPLPPGGQLNQGLLDHVVGHTTKLTREKLQGRGVLPEDRCKPLGSHGPGRVVSCIVHYKPVAAEDRFIPRFVDDYFRNMAVSKAAQTVCSAGPVRVMATKSTELAHI